MEAIDKKGSMTEFKQIIGRGTRINEDFGKNYFTIIDFKQATRLFADPDFDGDPVQIFEPPAGESPIPPDDEDDSIPEDAQVIIDPPAQPRGGRRTKYIVNGVDVSISGERVQYFGKDGKLITESIKDYTRKNIHQEFATLDDFLKRWSAAERKDAIIQELLDQGVLLEALAAEIGQDFDPFDLICHVAFDQPALSRQQRTQKVKQGNYFSKYSDKARAVIDALLSKYADEGIENIEDINVLKVKPISELGTPMEVIKLFGGKQKYQETLQELKAKLYMAS